jgi:subtilisin-like proprotein convertase family protein
MHSAYTRLLLFCLLFLCATGLALAQRSPLQDAPHSIADGGYPRLFDIALDEIFVGDELEKLPTARVSAEAMRQHALNRARASRAPTALVLYEVGAERTPATRRILSDRVVAELAAKADIRSIATAIQARAVETPDHTPGFAIFQAQDAVGAAFDLAARLREHPDVRSAEPELRRLRFKRYVPNDPLLSSQWHLLNTGQGGGTVGIDIRVTNVWAQGYFGDGIVIGIVDDGVQYTHPDLNPNYEAAYSRNWNGAPGGLFDPAPDTSWDDHGTPCAGLTSARGNNALGVSGVAPLSGFSGLRLISNEVGDSDEAEAMAFSNGHIYVKSNSWGPQDDGSTMEAPGALTRAALSNSTVTGRSGRGTLHVWAGGNGREESDNSNYDGYANSIYTIAIAALENFGQQASFSEPGANLVVTAPSDGGSRDIATTALMGQGDVPGNSDYTQTFGGTSAACPIAAGVVALMIDANPNLGWRDVQEILISTARQIDAADSDWSANSAGFTFNHKYGAGLIDAEAAVAAAQAWTPLGPQLIVATNQPSLGLSIPDHNAAGVSATFGVSTNIRMEHATVTLNISHAQRGQLEIFLTSPAGTESKLADTRADNNAHPSSWTYMTVRNWGESSAGTWTVRVADRVAGTSGTIADAHLTLFGTDATPTPDQPPVLAPVGNRFGAPGQLMQFTVTATDLIDHDLVTLTASNLPPWATFPDISSAGSISQTFSGTPSSTGVWTPTFFASDKDGTVSETITIIIQTSILSNFVGVLDESFDGGVPTGWSVTADGADGAIWRFDNPGNRDNYVGGTPPFAIADSDAAGEVNMDTSLYTPTMNLLTLSEVFLEFNSDFEIFEQATADVDISLQGPGGPWVNVWRQTSSKRESLEVIDLSEQAAGEANVAVRFRYHNANFDWWWQVDNIKLYGYEIDSDGDGIADAWELHYFGDLTTADATSDYSGNRFSDLHAFLANTNPTNANSLLRIEHGTVAPGGGVEIQWQSAPNRAYRIGRSIPGSTFAFTTIESNVPATPPLNTYTDPTATNVGPHIYRIELDL